jgi:hypothetical protein
MGEGAVGEMVRAEEGTVEEGAASPTRRLKPTVNKVSSLRDCKKDFTLPI